MAGSPSSAALVARRPRESWSYTDVNDSKVSHRWTINKFLLLCHSTGSDKNLKSLSFGGGDQGKWHLELDITLDEDDGDVYLSLYLDEPVKSPISVECKFSTLSIKRKRYKEKVVFLNSRQSSRRGCVRKSKLTERKELLKAQAKLLVGDRLTILCELCILLSCSDAITVISPPVTLPSNSILADLGSLLEGGLHSDVTLVAEGEEFQAHTLILSARSPVFERMFQHDMREREEKKVIISDLSADTVQEMLQHIYTGEVSTLEQSAESLLEAADKYDLPSLKSACEGTLRSKLEVENAARLLMLADKHHADQLKVECIRVIITYPQDVQESEDWSVLESERQDLLIEAGLSLFKCVAD